MRQFPPPLLAGDRLIFLPSVTFQQTVRLPKFLHTFQRKFRYPCNHFDGQFFFEHRQNHFHALVFHSLLINPRTQIAHGHHLLINICRRIHIKFVFSLLPQNFHGKLGVLKREMPQIIQEGSILFTKHLARLPLAAHLCHEFVRRDGFELGGGRLTDGV